MNTQANDQANTLLKLTVNNHPGVLSHVCGLFARRSYNLEGVIVRPIKDDPQNRSRMWLLVAERDRLQQLMRQTEKLNDVISIEQQDIAGSVFEHTDAFFR